VAGGTITGRSDPSFILIAPSADAPRVLFYGPDLRTTSRITGFVLGSASPSCSSSDPTTYNGKDYPSAARSYLFTAPLATAPDVSGAIRTAAGSASFTGGAIPGSNYVFNAAPRLADAAGAWTLTTVAGDTFRIEIGPDGALNGDARRAQLDQGGGGNPAENCKLGGTVTADPQARLNLLKLSLRSPCTDANFTTPFTGYALLVPLEAGGTQLLVWAETNNGVDWAYLLGIGRR
jgi:hypothetical protein